MRSFDPPDRSASLARTRSAGDAGASDFVLWALAALVAATTCISLPLRIASLNLGAYGWRAGSLLLALAMLTCCGYRIAAARPLLLVMAPWMAALTALTAAHLAHPQAWVEWFRHAYMIFVGACVFAGAQTADGRRLLARTVALMLVGLIALSVLPALMLIEGGWSWEAARLFKARNPAGLSLNSFIFLFALLVSAQWTLAGWRPSSLVATGAFLIACILFATRAPLTAAALAAGAAWLVAYWRGGQRLSPTSSALLSALVLILPLSFVAAAVADPTQGLGRSLAGRAQLWQISFAVWKDHPLFGAGPDAMASSLAAALNAGQFFADWQRENLLSLSGGGFHNIWLETLASKGLVGLFGLLASYFLLLRLALAGAAAGRGTALLFFALLLLGRGYVEVSGLFSYENSPHDFIAFVMVAAAMAAVLAGPAGVPATSEPGPRRFAGQAPRHDR